MSAPHARDDAHLREIATAARWFRVIVVAFVLAAVIFGVVYVTKQSNEGQSARLDCIATATSNAALDACE